MPGLVIEELNNKGEVEAETKITKGIAGASKRISRRNRRQRLSDEFVYKEDLLDLNSNSLSFKGV